MTPLTTRTEHTTGIADTVGVATLVGTVGEPVARERPARARAAQVDAGTGPGRRARMRAMLGT
ncbi:hypothetical protein ACTXG6_12915 [Pseudonocardia sp. Cha107L01]|uniref:hypothetical protein n=1 Tax=Pseudonocardia sp. Cha107L01 TaxID=3457576 RepID=UPI00403E3DC5